VQGSTRWCTPSASGTGFICGRAFSLVAFVALFILLFVPKTLVRSLRMYVGVASVASAGRLLKHISGLSFCDRVETTFDALLFHGFEEAWVSKERE
jgi:hypothetical protein